MVEVVSWLPEVEDLVAVLDGMVEHGDDVAGEEDGKCHAES